MKNDRIKQFVRFAQLAALLALIAVSVPAARRSPYSPHEKAFYANDATVQFVNPGLKITVNSAQIASDGTISVTYTLTDPKGLPLDAAGVTTPGTINLSYIAAALNGSNEYTNYTKRQITQNGGSALEPSSDSGGAATNVGPGQYQYVYHAKAPSGYTASATHTIGIYGSRNLTAYNLGTNYASATFNFVPNGAKVTQVHDVIRTASCDNCHDQLSFHGGARRGVEMCVLCHNSEMVDTSNGGSLDLKVMVHKMHMGASLPSVKAGQPLILNGTDFSKVVYPAEPGDPRPCETCHSQATGAAQANAYLTKPTRAACGACHNDVNLATGQNHAGGPQPDDNLCSTCHFPQGELDFDASIKGAHVSPISSSLLSGLIVNITKVQNGTAGSAPVVSFTVQDKNGNGVPLSQLGFINFTLAGPTTDYGYTSFGSDTAGTPGYVTEIAAANAKCDASGNCLYAFTHKIPANATGTYAIGAEARRTETVLAGTTKQRSITYGAPNKVTYISVDGSTVMPRRQIVALANCNHCHSVLTAHGSLRNTPEYCVLCHNPSNTDASVRGNAPVAADKNAPPQGIAFSLLVHRIHDGINMLGDGGSYTVVGFGGSHNDFSTTLYPAMSPNGKATALANCSMCHVNNSETNLPLGLNNIVNPQGYLNPEGATATACSGCHVAKDAAAHFASNTSQLGESCTVCHQLGAFMAVDKVHAQY
jgi:OmcA/MtrC family decaheme c-type cytochrome